MGFPKHTTYIYTYKLHIELLATETWIKNVVISSQELHSNALERRYANEFEKAEEGKSMKRPTLRNLIFISLSAYMYRSSPLNDICSAHL